MKTRCLLFLLLLAFTGCHSTVVRQTKVAHAETKVLAQASLQASESIKALIQMGCKCFEGSFTTPECEVAAKRALVIDARVPRIRDNMLFLIGVSETEPPKDIPPVPDTGTLCPPE